MANAWIIKPVPIYGVNASSGSGAMNLANDYAGVVWESQSTSSVVDLAVDLGVESTIDTLLIFGVDLAPAGATLRLFANTAATGPGFSPPTWTGDEQLLYAGTSRPAGAAGVCLWTAPPGFPAAVRYLLLRISHTSAMTLRASRIVVGKRLQLERNFGFGAAFGVRDLGSVDFNRRGVMSRARGKKMRTVGLTFSNINKDEVEGATKPLLEQIGNTEMIALVTDPAEHADRQNRCYFGPLVGDLNHVWRNARAFEAKINVVSIF